MNCEGDRRSRLPSEREVHIMSIRYLLILLGCGLWLGCRLFPPQTTVATVIEVMDGADRLVEVPPGESRAQIRFRLLNTGNVALAKPRIQRSCNCIDADIEPPTLLPHATADVMLDIVLARLERATGSGTVRLLWPDGSVTPLSFQVDRKRVPGLVLRTTILPRRILAEREHPAIAFVADYFPGRPPDIEQFAIRLDGRSAMPLENLLPVDEHAMTGHIMLDAEQLTCGTHRLEASDLPATELTVR